MTVLELINLLETCEDTFTVIVDGGTLHWDEPVVRIEQLPNDKCVRICIRDELLKEKVE